MKRLNTWIRSVQLNADKAISKCLDPVCSACQFGKSWWKPHTKNNKSISVAHTSPGAGVGTDQMEASHHLSDTSTSKFGWTTTHITCAPHISWVKWPQVAFGLQGQIWDICSQAYIDYSNYTCRQWCLCGCWLESCMWYELLVASQAQPELFSCMLWHTGQAQWLKTFSPL
jgi:hypothetical protein